VLSFRAGVTGLGHLSHCDALCIEINPTSTHILFAGHQQGTRGGPGVPRPPTALTTARFYRTPGVCTDVVSMRRQSSKSSASSRQGRTSTSKGKQKSAKAASAPARDPVVEAESRVARPNLSTNYVDANVLSATPLDAQQVQWRESGRPVVVSGRGAVGIPRLDVLRNLVDEDHSRSGAVFGSALVFLGVVNLLLSVGLPLFNGRVLSAALTTAGGYTEWLLEVLWHPPILAHRWIGQGPAAQWTAWFVFCGFVGFSSLVSLQVRLQITECGSGPLSWRLLSRFVICNHSYTAAGVRGIPGAVEADCGVEDRQTPATFALLHLPHRARDCASTRSCIVVV